MKNVNNVELLMERVNNFKDNLFVNVKISFLLEIMSKMGDIVYLDERLCSIIAKRYSKMKTLKEQNSDYISMTAGELKYLLEKTKDMNINRNMIVITNRARRK